MSLLERSRNLGRRLCNTVILPMLQRLCLFLMSYSESFQHQRILEEWPKRTKPPMLKLLLEEEQTLEIAVSREQAQALREMAALPIWQLYSRRLDDVTEMAHRWVLDAETPDDWRYRRGYLQGHVKTRQILDVLISQSETGDEEWAQAQMAKMEEQARAMLLTHQGRAGQPATRGEMAEPRSRIERLRQVMESTDRD